MKGIEVKKILKKNGIILKDLAEKMGVSPQHLQSILASDDITTGRLQQIEEASELQIFYYKSKFKDENLKSLPVSISGSSVQGDTIAQLESKIKALEEKIERKERTIENLAVSLKESTSNESRASMSKLPDLKSGT